MRGECITIIIWVPYRVSLSAPRPNSNRFMKIKLILIAAAFSVTGCSMYPLGHSNYGHYYGGQGMATAPRTYVPPAIQRQEPIL